MNDGYFLVYSREHNAWWGPNHKGYVCQIVLAGRYTEREARKICDSGKLSDGGPAEFMQLAPEHIGRTTGAPQSLRDDFAMAALTGILGSRTGFLVDNGTDSAGRWAYQVADSMLAARAAESEGT